MRWRGWPCGGKRERPGRRLESAYSGTGEAAPARATAAVKRSRASEGPLSPSAPYAVVGNLVMLCETGLAVCEGLIDQME